jgi:sodium transport system permease protein
MSIIGTVFLKELRDAARDRRTWLISSVVSLLAGPVVFLLISNFIGGLEERVAQREILIAGAEHAPTLVNFLQRAGANIKAAPEDYLARMRSGELQNAVVVPPRDFEARYARGETVRLDVFFDDSHDRAQAVVQASLRLLGAFNREVGTQRLLARGVSPQLLTPIALEENNLATSQSRGARLLFVVPWAALIVAVFGALSVAIDVSAGERERGSLEPLLMNPAPTLPLVLGKWGVVMAYSVAIVLLTLAGFVVSMQLVTSETLSAVMQLQAREAGIFFALMLPFAAMMAALNMLAATFGRSHKEAQTYVSYIAMLVQFSAVIPVFLTVRDALWQLFVPSVAHISVLLKALRGEQVSAAEILIPGAVCLLISAACLLLQARLLTKESIVFGRS